MSFRAPCWRPLTSSTTTRSPTRSSARASRRLTSRKSGWNGPSFTIRSATSSASVGSDSSEAAMVTSTANQTAYERLTRTEPVLIEIRPAIEVVPRMTRETILTSGPPMAWAEYVGGQRDAIIGGALHEGLARTRQDAIAMLDRGQISVSSCHEHDCIGSVAGIYTASMPVFVVDEKRSGLRAFCNFYEGPSRYRLNYGAYSEEVHRNLQHIAEVISPVLAEAVRLAGGVPLKPLIQRALHMGDELHSRNTAATILFTRDLFHPIVDVARQRPSDVAATLDFLRQSDYFFLRLSMATAKATA